MNKRNNMDDRITNDELARRLFQRDRAVKPAQPESSRQPTPEPLASRREPVEARQTWTLGRSQDDLGPISERERRALFAALSRGTRANLGREPTVAELVNLADQVDRARALVASTKDAIDGRLGVYFDGGKITFRGSVHSPAQERNTAGKTGAA